MVEKVLKETLIISVQKLKGSAVAALFTMTANPLVNQIERLLLDISVIRQRFQTDSP